MTLPGFIMILHSITKNKTKASDDLMMNILTYTRGCAISVTPLLSLAPSQPHSITHQFACLFHYFFYFGSIHSFFHSSIHPSIHPSIHSFIHSFFLPLSLRYPPHTSSQCLHSLSHHTLTSSLTQF